MKHNLPTMFSSNNDNWVPKTAFLVQGISEITRQNETKPATNSTNSAYRHSMRTRMGQETHKDVAWQ